MKYVNTATGEMVPDAQVRELIPGSGLLVQMADLVVQDVAHEPGKKEPTITERKVTQQIGPVRKLADGEKPPTPAPAFVRSNVPQQKKVGG